MTPKKINIDKEENESPVKKLSRKSSLKLLKTNKDEHMTLNTNDIIQIENVTLIGNTSKKRSLRNVAFDGKTYIIISTLLLVHVYLIYTQYNYILLHRNLRSMCRK